MKLQDSSDQRPDIQPPAAKEDKKGGGKDGDRKKGAKKDEDNKKGGKKDEDSKSKTKGSTRPDAGWKKCSLCKRWQELSCFYLKQSQCQACAINLKALRRAAKSQGHNEFLEEVQKDEEEFRALCAEFKKERLATKKGCTIRFAIGVWKDRYIQRSGTRIERQGEMMWHGEFLEFCRTAKMGWLTPEESEARWQELVNDKQSKQDRGGPRGFLRVRVPVRDMVTQFDEGSHERSFDRESSKINVTKLSDAELKRKAEGVYQDNGDNLLGSADFRQKLMRHAGTSDGDDGTFDEVALYGKDLQDMAEEVWL